jgi:hypothetical protein
MNLYGRLDRAVAGCAGRAGDAASNVTVWATTLRTMTPEIGAWRRAWADLVTRSSFRMIGRRQGREIVQLGKTESGRLLRSSFSQIRPQSLDWRGEPFTDIGLVWPTNEDFSARRVAVV